jgi:DNA-binding Lrp family transcriptional regulator
MVDYPIVVESEGVKIRSEKMEVDKLYYCIYQEKILLFYKEQNEMLNCYEITEKDVIAEVKQSQSDDIENILRHYIEKNNLHLSR